MVILLVSVRKLLRSPETWFFIFRFVKMFQMGFEQLLSNIGWLIFCIFKEPDRTVSRNFLSPKHNNQLILYRVRQISFFFGKCFKKKLLNIFSNFFFYLKVQSFRLILKNFIQMAASAGLAVAYTIGPIFKHIIDCVQLNFTNDITNIIL